MEHLNSSQVELAAQEGLTVLEPGGQAHLASCEECRSQVRGAEQLESALWRLPRAAPPVGLAYRISAALPARAADVFNWGALLSGAAAALAALLLMAFVFETALELESDGTLDLVTVLSSRPEWVVSYPVESLAALFQTLPLAQMSLTLLALLMVAWLTRRLVAALDAETHMETKIERST